MTQEITAPSHQLFALAHEDLACYAILQFLPLS